jgi:hypothetical protein
VTDLSIRAALTFHRGYKLSQEFQFTALSLNFCVLLTACRYHFMLFLVQSVRERAHQDWRAWMAIGNDAVGVTSMTRLCLLNGEVPSQLCSLEIILCIKILHIAIMRDCQPSLRSLTARPDRAAALVVSLPLQIAVITVIESYDTPATLPAIRSAGSSSHFTRYYQCNWGSHQFYI